MIRRIGILFIASFILSACRVNNGDIGNYFGSWLVYSVIIDGEPAPDFDSESTFFEFQNNIIFVTTVDKYYDKSYRVGTWSEDDGFLYLDFTHSSANIEAGTDWFQAPEWLYFPSNKVIPLKLFNASSSRMELIYNDSEGRVIQYYLRKIW